MKTKVIGRPWRPGESGNPNGRPVGARGRFTEKLAADVAEAWRKHGAGIVDLMATQEPMRFAELCARLMPKDVSLTLQQRLPGGLEADDWALALEVFQAVRDALPNAGDQQPGQVLTFVRDTIRSHSAQLIEAPTQQASNTNPEGEQ
jgi:hypothetical protein